MTSKIKDSLLILLLLILTLPLVQQCLPFITSGQLKGVVPPSADVHFSVQKWWDASYQTGKSTYLNDNLGFRPDIIRFTNQVYYSLLHKINHKRIVEGKDHNLFLNNFIDGYYGNDFIGYDKIHERVRELKAIQDTLTRLGKLFIVVFSPGKAYVYPENFPENLKLPKTKISNYEALLQNMDSVGLRYIDFNPWFKQLKQTDKEPLWSTLGIHWSVYGSYLAGDSLVSFIEQQRHIQMPHATWTKIEHTTKPRYNEHDISALMNMIYPIATVPYSYPVVNYTSDTKTVKPDILFIGDSFLFFWVQTNFLDNITSDWQLWYYFGTRLEKSHPDPVPMGSYDWAGKLDKTDMIVMMYTADNSDEFGNGFAESAYLHYYPLK